MAISSATAELLTLIQVPGIGPVTLLKLLRSGGEQGVVATAISNRPELDGIPLSRAKDRMKSVVNSCDEEGIAIVGYSDSNFPELLRRIPDPPPIIYVKGELGAIQRRGISVVGTRRASSSGRSFARAIASHLANNELPVISGLAPGIDRAAHRGALDSGGVTVAVLAHGLDTVSPRSHTDLAKEILDQNGALISEHPPGTPPRRFEFVRRNRLQSGISLGSIVIESGRTGGSIHQARFTVRQRRRLFTVLSKNSAGDLNQSGANRIISELGATAIYSNADLDDFLNEITLLDDQFLAPEIANSQDSVMQSELDI